MKRLIIIEGPTASGKTNISVELAKHFYTVILSADSRQFYKEMSIGTAKPSKEEQQGVKHYFIDSHSITEEITSANFAEEAMKILVEEFKIHDEIVLVGGSGMFIDALVFGLDEIPKSTELRDELSEEVRKNGLTNLLIELAERDPEFYKVIDKNNPVRIIRAIEAIRLSGLPFSQQRKAQKKVLPFNVERFIIEHDRDKLYERINLRVDLMIENGLIDEVKNLLPFQELNSLKTVGYTELFSYLNGQISLNAAIDLIKQNSRRYAKRQLTWFRKHTETHWIRYNSSDIMKQEILDILESR